ncbi:MAG: hypothetical protein PHN66_03455 [Candidatus Shapirobacteria bacterium]|nr:hypothetical protein [Candidatus Shapirobacteria bacterium]
MINLVEKTQLNLTGSELKKFFERTFPKELKNYSITQIKGGHFLIGFSWRGAKLRFTLTKDCYIFEQSGNKFAILAIQKQLELDSKEG